MDIVQRQWICCNRDQERVQTKRAMYRVPPPITFTKGLQHDEHGDPEPTHVFRLLHARLPFS